MAESESVTNLRVRCNRDAGRGRREDYKGKLWAVMEMFIIFNMVMVSQANT